MYIGGAIYKTVFNVVSNVYGTNIPTSISQKCIMNKQSFTHTVYEDKSLQCLVKIYIQREKIYQTA